MKKLLVLLAVALMAVPVLAEVTIQGSVDGKAVTLSYQKAEGEALRGIALVVEIENGELAGYADLAPLDTEFNAFIDYYVDNGVGAALPGEGAHPLCNPNAAGVAVLPAQVFGICMGYLDEDGDETLGEAAPGINTKLVTFTVTCLGETDAIVKVSLDGLRGGIVGDNITVNVPDDFEVATVECKSIVDPCPNKGFGDINNDGFVTAQDLSILFANWGQPASANPCADVNGDGFITAQDLSVLFANWGKPVQ